MQSRNLLRKAGEDPALNAMLVAAAGLPVGTGAVGVLDSLTGDTNFTNSGEIPLNLLLTLLPALTGSGALAAAMAVDPVTREAIVNHYKQGEIVAKARELENASAPTDVAGQVSRLASVKNLNKEASETLKFPELEKAYMSDAANIKNKVAPEDLLLKKYRRGGLAALMGAAGGAIPAVMGMMDQPAESLPVV